MDTDKHGSRPAVMKTVRHKPLLLLILLVGLTVVIGLVRLDSARGTAAVAAAGSSGKRSTPPARPTAAGTSEHRKIINAPVGQSRAEISRLLTRYFRREQVEAELAIEQSRYGQGYWQTEIGEKALLGLEQARAALLTRLNAEANEVLDEMSAGEPGEAIALAPLFGPGRAGPNVTFLSAESRARLVALIAEQSSEGGGGAAALLDAARRILPPEELARYVRWNAPEAALLRHQLVGFNASEEEFNAITRWSNFVNQGNAATAEDRRAELELGDRIGVQRLAELIQLRDPEVQTAVHDLHRLGLPLDRAAWLAASRAQGTREIQQLWSDPLLPPAIKEERVRELQQTYRARFVATLASSANALDGADLMP